VLRTAAAGPAVASPDVRAALAADSADEPPLNVRQPHAVRPAVAAHGDQVAALVIGAIDQQATHAHVAHVSEGDFLRTSHPSCRQMKKAARIMPSGLPGSKSFNTANALCPGSLKLSRTGAACNGG
jgi:hypothetical protein